MIKVLLIGYRLDRIISIVHELRNQNLTQGVDFDFEYLPPTWDGFSGRMTNHAIFTFYKDSLASWFSLKYVEDVTEANDDV